MCVYLYFFLLMLIVLWDLFLDLVRAGDVNFLYEHPVSQHDLLIARLSLCFEMPCLSHVKLFHVWVISPAFLDSTF